MARKISMAFFLSFVCILIFGSYVTNVDARTTQTALQKRTQLRPVAWPPGKKLWFAPGSCWVDEFEGGVQSGTLDEIRSLKIWTGNGKDLVFGKGFIRFERAAGEVKEGTLVNGVTLPVVNTAGRNNQTISLAPGTVVEFGYGGGVMVGTLNAASSYYPEGMTTRKKYPKGTVLHFTGAGEVRKAVLPLGESTNFDGRYNCNCIIPSQGFQFTCQVTASNGKFWGVKELDETAHLDYKGNYTKKGVMTNGFLTGWADIIDGNWRNLDQSRGPLVQGPKVRWTIQGPITGTFLSFSMRATSIDGAPVTKMINCLGVRVNANISTSVVLVLDLSGSMKGQKLADAKAAAKEVIRNMPADFEVGIMTYQGSCGQNFPFMAFTQDKQQLENAIDSLTTGGGTPLSGALTQAAQAIIKLGNGKQGKIILLCDGQDDCGGKPVSEASMIRKGLDVKIPKTGGKTSSARTRFWAYLNPEYWSTTLGPALAWAADPAGFKRIDFGKLPASPERQNIPIKIYTVGLQVSKSQQKVLDDVATAGGGTSASAQNMMELTKAFNDAIVDKPVPTPAPAPVSEPANRDQWQNTQRNTAPPPEPQNPQPTPQRPPSDDGWAPIGGSGSSSMQDKSGTSGGERSIPKGHSTRYGF